MEHVPKEIRKHFSKLTIFKMPHFTDLYASLERCRKHTSYKSAGKLSLIVGLEHNVQEICFLEIFPWNVFLVQNLNCMSSLWTCFRHILVRIWSCFLLFTYVMCEVMWYFLNCSHKCKWSLELIRSVDTELFGTLWNDKAMLEWHAQCSWWGLALTYLNTGEYSRSKTL